MPHFAANLWFLFTELDLMDRFGAAAGAGFRGVEIQFPYAWPKETLREELDRHGLQQVLINAPPGDYEAGERGLAALPGREQEFRDSVDLAIDYAQALGCPRIHVMAGIIGGDTGRERAMDTFVANLHAAATAAAEAGIQVLVEALNPIDVPGYLIGRTAEARAAIDGADHGNLFLQYDLYHGAMNGEDLEAGVRDNLGRIAHMQVAGVPGRNEPDDESGGDVDYPALFDAIDDMGYGGWIGCEYRPRLGGPGGTAAGLGWAAPWGIGA